MNQRKWLVACLAAGTMAVVAPSPQAAAQSSVVPAGPASVQRVDQLARDAQKGDPLVSRRLVQESLSLIGLTELPGHVGSSIVDRVARAEALYQAGEGKGLLPEDVARAVNNVASKLEAPEFAHTDAREVTALRLAAVLHFPHFLARGRGGDRLGPHSASLPALSPAEATFLGGLLLQQKASNPTFQTTVSERDCARARGREACRPANLEQRTRLLHAAIGQKAAGIGVVDLVDLHEQALDTLGVAR